MPTNHAYESFCGANGSLPSNDVVKHLDLPWCLVTPVQALVARLPTGRAPRPTSSRRMSPLGGSRRWGPLGALDEAAEDSGTESPARRRGARVPLSTMVQGAAISRYPPRRSLRPSSVASLISSSLLRRHRSAPEQRVSS